MKRLAIIPTAFALVAMVAACADMTAPEVTPPQFGDAGFSLGQCPLWFFLHFQAPTPAQAKADVNGDTRICVQVTGAGNIFIDNSVPRDVDLPSPIGT